MPKEYRFYLKCLLVPLLCGSEIFFIQKISESLDFITGFIIVVEIIIMLWMVYSIMRDLREIQKSGENTEEW